MDFARRHPALSMVGAAGALLAGGIELAAGALLGAGVVALLQRDGHAGKPAANEAHAMRERARERARELKRRTRAVFQAARGKIEPMPEIVVTPTHRPPSDDQPAPVM